MTLKLMKTILLCTFLIGCDSLFADFDNTLDLLEEEFLDFDAPISEINDLPFVYRNCSADDILTFLTPPVGVNAPLILQSNIYKKTNPINVRSLLDLPSLWPYYSLCNKRDFYIDFFYNGTHNVYFTKCSPYIKSYLDLSQQDAIEQLSQAPFLEGVEFGGVLDLFQNIRLFEHRIGFMVGFFRDYDSWCFNIYAPIYYLVHHFYLSQSDRDALENADFLKEFGPADPTTVEQFALDFLVNDRIGLGDTRIDLFYKIAEHYDNESYIGAQFTIPTAFNFKNGIYGGTFNPCAGVPCFSIEQLANYAIPQCGDTNVPKGAQYDIEFFNLVPYTGLALIL